MPDPSVFTMGQIAKRFGCAQWQVRRIFVRGLLPEPARVGAYRVVRAEDVPIVEVALRRAGYIDTTVRETAKAS